MKKLGRIGQHTMAIDNLSIAEDMALAEKSPRSIKWSTGWELGVEGKWKYEMPDNIRITNQYKGTVPGQTITLKEAIIAPSLFEEYPDIANLKVTKIFDNENKGFFDAANGLIEISMMFNDVQSTLIHEIQHWIQKEEGFEEGSSTADAVKMLP